jgi:hypothetical protein
MWETEFYEAAVRRGKSGMGWPEIALTRPDGCPQKSGAVALFPTCLFARYRQ